MKKKILITGSSGQLGSALQSSLSVNFDILSTSKIKSDSLSYLKNNKILDITNRNNVSYILNYFSPDIIINCAAFTNVDMSESNKKNAHNVNVLGLENLIKYSDKNIYIIQISSDYVFNGNLGPYKEDDLTYPVNYYGKTKLEAENILRGSNCRWTIFRPNVIYSYNLKCKDNFFTWIYRSLLNKNHKQSFSDSVCKGPQHLAYSC